MKSFFYIGLLSVSGITLCAGGAISQKGGSPYQKDIKRARAIIDNPSTSAFVRAEKRCFLGSLYTRKSLEAEPVVFNDDARNALELFLSVKDDVNASSELRAQVRHFLGTLYSLRGAQEDFSEAAVLFESVVVDNKASKEVQLLSRLGRGLVYLNGEGFIKSGLSALSCFESVRDDQGASADVKNAAQDFINKYNAEKAERVRLWHSLLLCAEERYQEICAEQKDQDAQKKSDNINLSQQRKRRRR